MVYWLVASAHAVALLALAGFTAFVCVRYRARPPSVRHAGVSLLAGIATLALGSIMTCGCPDLRPRGQLLIPPLAAVALTALTRPSHLKPNARRVVYASVALAMLSCPLLMGVYIGMAHGSPYTGNPPLLLRRGAGSRRSHSKSVRLHLGRAKVPPGTRCPAGWLADSPALQLLLAGSLTPTERAEELRDQQAECFSEDRVGYSFWHSWFTGLYGIRQTARYELWSPGGTPNQMAAGLEWRRREPPPTSTRDGVGSL